ncbi:MAG TPA: class E sortase [Nocardioidaceae bacterium]|nr:class E sortase [Nocardioidaceae bacterium]
MARPLFEPSPAGAGAGRRRRGGALWAGLVLVAAGCVLLGYAGWQFFGTNLVSQRKQERIVDETIAAWSRPQPAPVPARRGSRPAAGVAAALVRIPAFGERYRVPVQEGVSDRVLAEGLGHFRGTANPGEVGNFALAGHRVTHGEPLRDLPSLRPGDEVVVETRDRSFTYRLDTDPRDLVVTFEDVWVIADLPRNPAGGAQPVQRPGQRLITLTTCSELFHTDNRMIAFGHLVSSRPRSTR